ncbi:MAG: patatin-like phospholipase family protein [Brumimicrobium sp.]
MKKIRILSIDGGGIRGILPGTILAYIEGELKKYDKEATIGKYFDFIAGTSTGGILALLYLFADENGKFKYTATEALNLYLNHGSEIFDVSMKKKISSLYGLIDEKYSEKKIEKYLSSYLNDETLSQLLKPSLVTSYDMRNRRAHFFTSHDAHNAISNFYLKDVARATSAAPTYFEPAQIKSVYGTPFTLIDGGVFANNPSLCAYSEARTIPFSSILKDDKKPDFPSAKDMLIVSLGTGTIKEPYMFEDYKDASKIKWIKPTLDMMMSGNAETMHHHLKQIYGTLNVKDQTNYYRIQPDLNYADHKMDNASSENIKALHNDGKLAVTKHKNILDKIVKKLVENK